MVEKNGEQGANSESAPANLAPINVTDNKVIIISDNSGDSCSVSVYDPKTGSMLKSYRNAGPIGHNGLVILNQSYLLAADLTKPRLYVWAVNCQTQLPNFRLTTSGKVTALASTPDGSYIVAAVTEILFIWQTSTGRLLNVFDKHYQAVTCLSFTGDGSNFASGGDDGLVVLWSLAKVVNNCEDNGLVHKFSDHTLPVKGVYLGNFAAKARLITVSLDQTARIYDSNIGVKLLTLIFNVPLTSVCADIRECNLFVGCVDGTIRQFNMREPPRNTDHHVTDKEFTFKQHTKSVSNLSVSTDCMTLLSGGSDGFVFVWDVASRQVIRKFVCKGPITNAFFGSLGNYDAVTFRPKLTFKQLQRVTDQHKEDHVIEIISKNDSSKLLYPNVYLENNVEFATHKVVFEPFDVAEKLVEANAEIERLKQINADLFQSSIQNILDSD